MSDSQRNGGVPHRGRARTEPGAQRGPDRHPPGIGAGRGRVGRQAARSRPGSRTVRVVALACVLATGCGDGSGPPQPSQGQLEVALESPNGSEGAVLLELDVPVSSLQAVGGEVFQETVDGRTRILALDDAGEIRFRIGVADTREPPPHRIIEVAGPDNALRGDLSGYALTFAVR